MVSHLTTRLAYHPSISPIHLSAVKTTNPSYVGHYQSLSTFSAAIGLVNIDAFIYTVYSAKSEDPGLRQPKAWAVRQPHFQPPLKKRHSPVPTHLNGAELHPLGLEFD